MDPREFHQFAAKLAAKASGTPAECRSAISRAYYSAFHVANDTLELLGTRVPANRDAHVAVENALRSIPDPQSAEMGALLGDLRTKRIEADYRLSRPDSESLNTARIYVGIAESLLRLLAACVEEPRKSALIAAIQAKPR